MAEADIDLYGEDLDDDFNQDGDYNHDSNVDLYDDVLTAPSEGVPNDEGRPSSTGSTTSPHHEHQRNHGKRVAVYIGNLTWWTTDQDIIDAVQSLGVNDVLEVKFNENRANGQSKGFCLLALSSESSLRTVMEKLPKKLIHDKNPEVLLCSKQSLSHFETLSRKGSGHGVPGGNRYDGDKPYRDRERERERDRDCRDGRIDNRGNQDRVRSRGNAPPPSYHMQNRQQPAPSVNHPPPAQPPPGPPQYPPGRAPWMTGPPPPQMYQMPPSTRPGMPPNTSAPPPPPPPGLQAPPPPRPVPPPHANIRMLQASNVSIAIPPPPRGPLPPMGPRNVPPPDPRGPPPQHEWDRISVSHPPPQNANLPGHPGAPPSRPPPPVQAPGQGMPPSVQPTSHPPAPHVNPAFFLPHNQSVSANMPPTSQPVDIYNRPPPVQYPDYRPSNDRGSEPSTPAISEAEFEDIMGRNRTVSSSAISRAVADASAGDYASAVETLVTAISLIKQSKIANDERCKIVISSLQDTLHGIESKSYSSSRSKERARSRERSRERSSRREKSSRRDRSRSRDYRDRSRERDRYHDDRYHDKDHDRDRDRDRRSHRH